MDLLSDAAYWLAGALALVALVAGAWLTSRTPRNWKGTLLNGVAVLVAGVMMVTSVGLVLNRQNGWYSSVGDLFQSAQSTTDNYGAGSPFEGAEGAAPAAPPPAATLPPLPTRDRIQRFDVPTSVGHQTWNVTVILPPDYFAAESSAKTYPVVYAGHGFPGSPQQYLEAFDIQKMGDNAVRARSIKPFITVIPNITPTGADTECITGPDDVQQLETWLAKDVPAFVAGHLRAAPGRTNAAWLGFSLGGWCGTMLTMRHPETFGAAAALGGYYQPWWVGPAPWPAGDARADGYDLVKMAGDKPPAVALWVQSSRKDTQSWPRTEQFLKAVKPPLSVTAVIDSSGGHNFSGWVGHGPAVLTWLGETVPGFKP
ncbi:alpha/beta hydrolase-fold protein [Ammonicoccus fulvus]|uniref:Alpha/beta hydrolase-fold protein n=1 Tax=Ammonicoccus fulvus TaxID=3138240 RepID=A0ABZ3FNB3_9ACTN